MDASRTRLEPKNCRYCYLQIESDPSNSISLVAFIANAQWRDLHRSVEVDEPWIEFCPGSLEHLQKCPTYGSHSDRGGRCSYHNTEHEPLDALEQLAYNLSLKT